MQIDRRITNGLAWAGVVLVVGVPLADVVSARLMGDEAGVRPAQIAMVAPVAPVPVALSARPSAPVAKPVTPPAAAQQAAPVQPATPVQTAAATPLAAAPSAHNDVVDSYLKAGKPLPSYITGGSATQASVQPVAPNETPAPVAASTPDPLATAALTPARIAPIPMPLSMRPQPALIVEETPRSWSTQISPSVSPRSSATVTYGDLQDWETGPLAEFLAKRQAAPEAVAPDYDPDGFYLDEGPNGTRSRDRLIGPAEPMLFPFTN